MEGKHCQIRIIFRAYTSLFEFYFIILEKVYYLVTKSFFKSLRDIKVGKKFFLYHSIHVVF